MKFWYL